MLLEKIKLEPGEKIIKTVRKHWFVIVTELFASFIMMLLPFFILFIISSFPNIIASLEISLSDYTTLITFGIATWLIMSLMVAFMIWTHYYLDLWIITDRRIILVDQIAFFHRNVSVFRLERLQEIEVEIRGVLATFLNFGSIRAQTAGHSEIDFQSSGIPDPRYMQSVIQGAMDERLAQLHIRPDESD